MIFYAARILLFIGAAAAALVCAQAQSPLPLSDDARSLLRSSAVRQPELRVFVHPQSEEAFLRIAAESDSPRDARIHAYQARFQNRARGVWTDQADGADLFALVGGRIDAVVLSGEEKSERMAALSIRAAAGADFRKDGSGWTAACDLYSRVESGDAAVSPFQRETDAGRYGSFRMPNQLRTYLDWRGGRFRFSIGRQTAQWGPGMRHGLLLSEAAGPMPAARAEAQIGNARVTALIASLTGPEEEAGGGHIPKYLAAHRLEMQISDRWTAAVSESVVWIRRFDLKYLNPLDIFYLDTDPIQPDNRNVSLELSAFFRRRLQLYAELLIDDFQPQEGLGALRAWGTKGGARLGALWTEPFQIRNAQIWAEGLFINQFAYTHKREGAEYAHRGIALGHPDGPDAFAAAVQAEYRWTERVAATAEWKRTLKGEGGLFAPREPDGPERWEFLSGAAERTNRWSFEAEYSVVEGFLARGSLALERTANAGHLLGKRARSMRAHLVLGYHL